MHYARQYRNGSFDPPTFGKHVTTNHGYQVAWKPDHELAQKDGLVYVHRLELFNAIGLGPHACHWCGVEVAWKAKGRAKLVVDHLDGDKLNNVPPNLVPSCHRCNSTRGLFMSWVSEHADDPVLMAMFDRARRAG